MNARFSLEIRWFGMVFTLHPLLVCGRPDFPQSIPLFLALDPLLGFAEAPLKLLAPEQILTLVGFGIGDPPHSAFRFGVLVALLWHAGTDSALRNSFRRASEMPLAPRGARAR